jgi:hypothetical protein
MRRFRRVRAYDTTHVAETYRDGVGLLRYRCCLRLVSQGHDLFWSKDCIDLAAGIVPRVVQAMARTLLEDLDTMSRRNAAKPVHEPKKKKSKRTAEGNGL